MCVLVGREAGWAYHSTVWNLLSHFLLGNTLKKKKRFKQQSKEQVIKKKGKKTAKNHPGQ